MSTVRAALHAMGTRFEILLCGRDPMELRAVAEEALDEVSRLERRWNRFAADSEISRVNRQAAVEPVRVSAELMELLFCAKEICKITDGLFDPSVGSRMERPARGVEATCSSVREERHAEVAGEPGMVLVELDSTHRTVRFLREGMRLDLGAIGKGCALDIAAEVCRAQGVESGLIHAGTSSVLALGPENGRAWSVGIPTVESAKRIHRGHSPANLTKELDLLGVLELKENEALGVSAPWGGASLSEEGAASHIVDPRTGLAVDRVALSAVVTSLAAEADALSTALVVGGERLQEELSRSEFQLRSLIVLGGCGEQDFRVVDCGLLGGP